MKRKSHNIQWKIIAGLLVLVAAIVIFLSFISAVPYLDGNKSVSPTTLYVGESAIITLSVNGMGSSYTSTKPVDVMLVIDNSCSMQGTKILDAKAAGNLVIDELIASDRAGMVSFNTNPILRSQFTSDFNSVRTKINALTVCGNTNIGEAINLAMNQFSGSNARALVLISDGRTNLPANAQAYALAKAREAGYKNITIFTIGIGSDVNSNLLGGIATAGNGLYFHYPTGNALDGLFNSISQQINNLAGTNTVITDILAQGVVPAILPSECSYNLNSRTVTCNAGSLNIGESRTFSFNVVVYNSSLTNLNEIAYVNYTNYQNNNVSFILNNPNVTISHSNITCVNCNNTNNNTTITNTTNGTIYTGNTTVNFTTTNSTNGTVINSTNTHVHTSSCGHTHAPVNDFADSDVNNSISMDDDYIISLNYVNNSSNTTGFSLDSFANGENNNLIFNMILLIAILVLLLLIILIARR